MIFGNCTNEHKATVQRTRTPVCVLRASANILLCVCAAILLISPQVFALPSPGDLTSLTGGRMVKVVWWQANNIMGYDTDKGQVFTIKTNVPMQDLYGPLFTADGNRILYWRNNEKNIAGTYSIAWDGTDDHLVVDSCKPGKTWVDNPTGKEWLFGYRRSTSENRYMQLFRCDLAATSGRQVIAETANPWVTVHQSGSFVLVQRWGYNVTSSGQVKDGRYYSAYGTIKLSDIGCGTNLSPDPADPDRMITLGEGHAKFNLSGAPRTIDFPRTDGESWYVRWSNNVKILSVVSPSPSSGGPVWIGKFSADMTTMEKWVKLIDGPATSAYTWVAPACLDKPVITRQPRDTVFTEGGVSYLGFGLTGCGKLTYQWFRNGTALAGATLSRCQIPTTMADSGSRYYCTITNEHGTVTTSSAQVSIRRDVQKPYITSVSAPQVGRIVVQFNEPVRADSATTLSHYSITPGIDILKAELQPDLRTVWLITSSLASGTTYQLTVSGIVDRADRPNLLQNSPVQKTFTYSTTDKTAPTAPTNLAVLSIASTGIQLGWDKATDNVGVVAYQVLRGSAEVGRTAALSFIDSTISTGIEYSYTVSALDAAGNKSPASNAVTATATKPVFKVTGPGQGSTFPVGDTLPLSWRVDRTAIGNAGIVFYISPDNGRVWVPIMSDQQYNPGQDTGTYKWKIPAMVGEVSLLSNQVRLKVVDYNHGFEPGILPWTIAIGPLGSLTGYRLSVSKELFNIHGGQLSIGPMSECGSVELFGIGGRLIYKKVIAKGATLHLPDDLAAHYARIIRIRSNGRTVKTVFWPHP